VGNSAIYVYTSHVTLDLNGFALLGAGASGSGVQLYPTGTNIVADVVIRNGTISRWNENGINASSGFGVVDVICERLRVTDNLGRGVQINGSGIVRNCVVSSNRDNGIQLWRGFVSDCLVEGNLTGISSVLGEAQVKDCQVYFNSNVGISANGGIVTGCNVSSNANYGVMASHDTDIRNNRISGHTGLGSAGVYVTGWRNRIENNNIVNNYAGLDYYHDGSGYITNNLIVRNVFSGNQFDMYFALPKNTVPTPVSPGNAITNVSPWANISY
jgi:hypothetical protein